MYRENYRQTGKIEISALKQPSKRADAHFKLLSYAQLGQTDVIETTTNLNTWIVLINLVITNMPMDVVDLTASNSPTCFRLAVSP